MNCSDCKFFNDENHRLAANGNKSSDDAKNVPAGTCRRYAPSARNGNWRAWPTVIATDFCYDHQLRETAPPTPAPAINFAIEVPTPVTIDSAPTSVIEPALTPPGRRGRKRNA